jgi:CheY-specific phosphatase CheX
VTELTIREALSSAVTEVLESMFFLEALGEAEDSSADGDTITARMIFDGDPPGSFRMWLERKAANAIAADFLGEDATVLTVQQCTDVILELANMICGAVLSRVESRATFRLGGPHTQTLDSGVIEPAEETRYTVETGRGTLTVAIHMETRTCQATER